jgi:hypothetical protein
MADPLQQRFPSRLLNRPENTTSRENARRRVTDADRQSRDVENGQSGTFQMRDHQPIRRTRSGINAVQ